MRFFMCVIICVAMVGSFLGSPEVHVLPSGVRYLPDMISGIVAVYVFAAGLLQRFRYVNPKYWLIFAALALAISCGSIINQEDPTPIITFARYYVRAVPFFFLPSVIEFSERDLKTYMKLILGFSLLQLPVNVYQRRTGLGRGEFTGDIVTGTLLDSGFVTLSIVCVMCVMTALMIRGRIGKITYAVCFVLMTIAISINETKVTLFLLPTALLITFVVASPPGRRLKGTLQALAVLGIVGSIFVPLYNSLNLKNNGQQFYTVEDFITNPDALSKYMNHHTKVGTGTEASGRGDAIEAPFRALSSDPIKLAFGLGIGNVSQSGVGEQYSGRYVRLYWNFAQVMAMSTFLFEIGVVGASLILLLHLMFLKDALFVGKRDKSLLGVIALGYVGAWLTVTIGLFYDCLESCEAISFMFWFFSGLVAAQRQRLALTSKKVVPTSEPRAFKLNTAH